MRENKITANRWLQFADDDLRAIDLLISNDLFAPACFHAQQVAEKCLKAIIALSSLPIPKIHSLLELYEVCKFNGQSLGSLEKAIQTLNRFYILVRYPDAFPGSLQDGLPNKADALEARDYAKDVFEFAKQKIG